jgi:hypothetical protein
MTANGRVSSIQNRTCKRRFGNSFSMDYSDHRDLPEFEECGSRAIITKAGGIRCGVIRR